MDGHNARLMAESAGERLALIMRSYHRLTGHVLADDAHTLWRAPFTVLAHDTSAPPEFIYANSYALTLFKRSAKDMIGLPSHLSAQADAREQRAAMFAQLEAADIVTGYCGMRIAADGTRFRIRDAVIWNLRDDDRNLCGQAARIDRVEMPD
ncbi:MEKHLA domain-containing protein [Aurantiacibacter rhizosphaerae]|nr:MEKHLA domain-containing protein [Aurantiacibacter rhizosphaerae]